MADEDAVFAGEVTGHYYFGDFYHANSGILPSLVLLELLSRREIKISELLAPLESRYFITGEVNSTVSDSKAKIAELASSFPGWSAEPAGWTFGKLSDLALQRAWSDTEPSCD